LDFKVRIFKRELVLPLYITYKLNIFLHALTRPKNDYIKAKRIKNVKIVVNSNSTREEGRRRI